MAAEDQQLVETIDTGDCFYDAFAIGLSQVLDKPITMQDVRNQLKKEIDTLNASNSSNWFKTAYEADKQNLESYETYCNLIGKSAKDLEEEAVAGEKRYYPIWGRPEIEGELLCRHYNVQLEMVGVHVLDDIIENIPEKYAIEESTYPKKNPLLKPRDVVYIAAYPGHFLGVKNTF